MRNPAKPLAALVATVAMVLSTGGIQAQKRNRNIQPDSTYLVATTHGVPADGKTDATEAIQRLIDGNPNRTIFFPDGTYLISRSILTPADPKKSVTLVLGHYAVMKATGDWSEGGAVIRLGASHPYNDIKINGSNYGLYGGIIDGSGVADGVSIDGGRETKICDVSIKHTQTGIHIKKGANSGSSDADISDVNIVGNNKANSIGVLVEGYDNTFTNMRIYHINIGVWIKSAGNSLRNIHPLYGAGKEQVYDTSVGFLIEGWNNWFDFCYSDQLATAFLLKKGSSANLTNCFCYWYSGKVPFQTAIKAEGQFNSIVAGFRAGFHSECPKHTLLQVEESGGTGAMLYPFVPRDAKYSDDDASKEYIK